MCLSRWVRLGNFFPQRSQNTASLSWNLYMCHWMFELWGIIWLQISHALPSLLLPALIFLFWYLWNSRCLYIFLLVGKLFPHSGQINERSSCLCMCFSNFVLNSNFAKQTSHWNNLVHLGHSTSVPSISFHREHLFLYPIFLIIAYAKISFSKDNISWSKM